MTETGKTQPLVSVIIPTRNRPQFLREAIESVQNQTYQNWELIVVDDGSDEAVPRSVLEGTQFGRLIRIEESAGVSNARNIGIDEAKGEFLAFLDDDDIWSENKLALQVKVMMECPAVGLCGGGSLPVDENGTPVDSPNIRPGYVSLESLSIWVSIPGSASNALVRTCVLRETGGFDPSLHRSEDWDLWWRIANVSQVFNVADVTVMIRRHSAFRRPTNYKEILAARSKLHDRLPGPRLKREAYAFTFQRLSEMATRDQRFWLSSAFLIRSLMAWPFPIRFGSRRVRERLGGLVHLLRTLASNSSVWGHFKRRK